jgi:hypothetical protein
MISFRALAGTLGVCLLCSSPVLAQPEPERQTLRVGQAPGARGHLAGETSSSGSGVEVEVEVRPGEPRVTLKGRLIAYSKKLVREAFEHGAGHRERLEIADFLHVGISGDVYLVKQRHLLPEQRKALENNPRHVWIATKIEGGIRLPFTASISLGEANVSVGFEPGAALEYQVVDMYPLPDGVTDGRTVVSNLKAIGKRAFDLPLSADEARAETLGAHRKLHGYWKVAITGSIGIGEDLDHLGNDLIRMGASARVGGFYLLKDYLEFQTTRLAGDDVRLRVRDGRRHTIQADARLFLGASIGPSDLRDDVFGPTASYLEPILDLPLNPIRGEVEDILEIKLEGRRGVGRGNEVDISYRFDLSVADAAAAYERAVRGDLTVAADLAQKADSGVIEEYRVLDVEEKTYRDAEIKISLIFRAGFSKSLSAKDLLVRDADGVNHYEVFRFDRRRRVSWFDRDWDRRLHAEVLGKRGENMGHLAERSFRFKYTIKDGWTRLGEVRELRRAIASWNLPGTDEATMPEPSRRFLRSRYSKTKSAMSIDISDEGLEGIFAQPASVFRASYLAAVEAVSGQAPGYWDRRRAGKFSKALSGLAAATSKADRAQGLGRLAESSDWDLYVITAIVRLAPPETLHVRASILGTRVSYSGELTGDRFEETTPALHGH